MRIPAESRPISAVYQDSMCERVGDGGVTMIVPYEENGEMALFLELKYLREINYISICRLLIYALNM